MLPKRWIGFVLSSLLVSFLFIRCTSTEKNTKGRILCSASLYPALEKILSSDSFPSMEGISGGSGHLLFQIKQGLPFDVWFCADSAYAYQLAKDAIAHPPILIGYMEPYYCYDTTKVAKKIAISDTILTPFGKKSWSFHQKNYPSSSVEFHWSTDVSTAALWCINGEVDACYTSYAYTLHLRKKRKECKCSALFDSHLPVYASVSLLSTSGKEYVQQLISKEQTKIWQDIGVLLTDN